MPQVKGAFDIKSTPLPPIDDGLNVMRMQFDKRFHGALDGTGVATMVGFMNKEVGSGAYVAIERVKGVLGGMSGSFYFQHNSTMTRGKPSQSITVVPDSGTESLKGLTGSMVIDIVKGAHFYTFNYELP